MEIKLDFLLYWKWIIKRWKLIVAMTMIFAIAAGVHSYFIVQPTYTATTTMLVQSTQPNESVALNELIVNQKLLKTYTDLIRSRQVAEAVITQLDLNMSVETLLSKVRIDTPNDTLVAKITVTDGDPARAVAIANGVAFAFTNNLLTIMKVDNASVLDEARLSPNPVPTSPNPKQDAGMAGAGGLIVGVLLALVIGFFDKSIKSESEVEELLGIPVLGVIANFDLKDKSKKKKSKKRKGRGTPAGGVIREG